MQQRTNWNEVIVALATPPGIGAIGVIRLSGNGSISLINEMFPSKDLSVQKANTLHVGLLMDGNKLLDEVVISLFKGPRSYTGEDVIEISCHGSPYIQQQVMEACISRGARLANPGEFTLRAFLRGKMDLVQAEAVADLIASGTKAAQETALNQIRGGFSSVLAFLREELIKFSALIELELDFSQEDVEFADRTALRTLLDQIETSVNDLLASFKLGNVIKNGVNVAIVGKPNAGKSTLLNALLKENRAIVSAIAGTTRDTIEEVLNIDGILFRLIDTAGIREGADEIEAIGVEKSREKMKSADIVLYLFDASADEKADVEAMQLELNQVARSWIMIGNKVDDPAAVPSIASNYGLKDAVYISAKQNMHLDALKLTLTEKVISGGVNTENTIVTNARHYQSLQKLSSILMAIRTGMQENIPGDLLSIDIRECLYQLGEITGQISNEDQLDFIFSKFCIGK
ncbi:MAG: tRNA uridine-5-carboxymethylaminomethyl(34) synthesis GTPase MnmE [Chitinophagaceae bacterium]|jgi:tRNA modification GTPase|nr:tRNA uridine-5-carboxymethylaminomethyl(34) synthesis GTPase MnmE [Chitinophagaceae bacterium]